MNYREAFNLTLKKFDIKAKDLAKATGIQERQISLFRNGKDLMAQNLFSLVAAMPSDARAYFFSCIGAELLDWESLILSMPPAQISKVLNLAAISLTTSKNPTSRELIPA